MKQMTEQLDIEKERHSQTKESLNKLKQVCVHFYTYIIRTVVNLLAYGMMYL